MPLYVLPGSNPGLLVRGNIDIDARTFVGVPVGGGKLASVRSTSYWIGERLSDQEVARVYARYKLGPVRPLNKFFPQVLIPEVIRSGGRWIAVPGPRALQHFRSTGKHLGIFDSPAHANSYGNRLHLQQAAAVKKRTRTR